MALCYSCLLTLLVLLLITHEINTANRLRSFLLSSSKLSPDRRYSPLIIKNEVTTSEPVLSRRRPLLSSNERRRRWTKDDILIDETIIEQLTSATTIDNNATVLIDKLDDIFLFNSTIGIEQLNVEENSTIIDIKYPLLRQDILEMNETDDLSTTSINQNISEKYETDLENNSVTMINTIFLTTTTVSDVPLVNITDINQITSNETNEFVTTNTIDNLTTIATINNETETSTNTNIFNQTIEELITTLNSTLSLSEQDTSIILLDHTATPRTTAYDNQTSNDSDTTIIDDNINTTTIFNSIQNEILTTIVDENEYANETINFQSDIALEPVCDLACQCLKQCPYGFELLNDTCECDPPCKNYQCFGNDTCIVTTEGRPICEPENGTEHDRPKRCYQPRYEGYHDLNNRYYDRYYYNPDQDECHLLVYRGMGGNENNFVTLNECHLECITCGPAPNPGECLGRLPMWYYDHKKNQCSQFDYTGCKGNENQFFQKQKCIDTCVTRILNL
ncbi:unnamed protein product [Adineta steineri]|uniref:BPTI/Kunitz inhibitor domain-containing protein n=1 Tax=Adineta steineri TaxID=433720 RepID=A0A814GDV5_9BILA|nr:unnamed protein product [Adineta steineri]CAF1113037.1 unnamed protein product [Adineta steineri]